jgi:dihydropteroate synthase
VLLPSGNVLDFSGPALIMAIINCNGDSFYAPSRALGDEAVEKALAAEEEGAAIIDFGGESSRPRSSYVDEKTELERVIPVISAFRKRSSLPVSVDTRKAAVARSALNAGADIINDISGLADDPSMAAVCAEQGAAVVLMHKRGIPLTMQDSPCYENLAAELGSWFHAAVERAVSGGISREKIMLDPGFGFGKNLEDNLEILRRLAEICGKDYPLLVGLSQKSFIGEITGRNNAGRLPGTLAANGAAIMAGADIIRVHDVKEHMDLAKVLFALRSGRQDRSSRSGF